MFTAHIDPIQRLFYKDGNGNPDNQDYGYDPLDIVRATVMLEDWKPGHYLEVNSVPYVNWRAGDTVEWVYDTPHMAANIGLEDRYTLQITGHL